MKSFPILDKLVCQSYRKMAHAAQKLSASISAIYKSQYEINCDGSWDQDIGIAGAGGVIRDWLGSWIGGYFLKCGSSAIDRAELRGILHGLRVAWDATSIKMINEGVSDSHRLFDLVFAVRKMIHRDWECVTRYIPREKNQVGDWLAKSSLKLDRKFVYFEFPPPGVGKFLLADSMCISFLRLVRTDQFFLGSLTLVCTKKKLQKNFSRPLKNLT